MGGELTTGDEDTSRGSDVMSEEARAAVFAAANAGDRSTALRSVNARFP